MRVCEKYRVSHSHFLGGPAVWTDTDRDKAIWWHVRSSETCGSCGTRRAEWLDEDGNPWNAFTAEKVRCHGCEAKERTEKSIKESDGKGIRVELRRRDRG